MLISFLAGLAGTSLTTGCAGGGGPATEDNVEGISSALSAAEGSSAESPPTPAGIPSVATIELNSDRGRLSSIAVGANAAAWDGNLIDPEVPELLRAAGLQVMRYPGGSTSDNYHWSSNTVDDPNVGGIDPSANFDAYMSVVAKVGAQPMITVNYGSGTAQEAADWVRYANRGGRHYQGPIPTYPGASRRGRDYQIRYWEIGNELYGDGTYGATWEVNHQSHDPSTYAQGVVGFSAAMKAADPCIHVGMVLTAPGNWPDGQINQASPQPWNDTVLPIACQAIDFVTIHWYAQGPTGESDAALLMAPQKGEATPVSYTPDIPSMMAAVRSQLARYCGAHAEAVQIMVTETNSVSYNPGKQTTSLVNALFLADQMMTWFENGATNVNWWAIHNSPFDGNIGASLYGGYTFGDYGVLSRGLTTTSGVVEPPANTPFPTYYGLAMLAKLAGHPQATMLRTSSSNELVSVHATSRAGGGVTVMLVNKDPGVTYDVSVNVPGMAARGTAKVSRYGIDSTSIAVSSRPVRGSSFTIGIPPYSLTTIKLP